MVVTKPKQNLTTPSVSYDEPKHTKNIDLTSPQGETKPMYIAIDLRLEEKRKLIKILFKFRDIFSWSYKDLKHSYPIICQHTIPL